MTTITGLNEAIKHIEDGIEKGISEGLDELAKQGQDLLEKPASNWKHGPTITVKKTRDERTVETESTPYVWVSGGTKAHPIVAKNAKRLAFPVGGSPKTTPNSLNAGSGSAGGAVLFRKAVRHPGVKARNFDQAAAKELEKDAEPVMERELTKALS